MTAQEATSADLSPSQPRGGHLSLLPRSEAQDAQPHIWRIVWRDGAKHFGEWCDTENHTERLCGQLRRRGLEPIPYRVTVWED